MKKRKSQKGSITIEATVGLTAFIFVIVSIFSFINICRAQMVVSLAVDATAKEMSQYSYFYGLSGLQSVADVLEESSGEAKSDTNELIGYTKTMCTGLSSIGGEMKNVAGNVGQAGEEIGNAASLESALTSIQQTAKNMQASAQNMKSDAEAVKNAVQSFESKVKGMDAESYMRSLGALVANESYHAVLSRLICPALAKAMCVKHIEGYADGDADAALKSMGIVEGMDGLNFLMSDMFSAENPTQIHLVCYYTVELSSLVDLPGDTRMVFCKESVSNAWLNGYSKKSVDAQASGGSGADSGENGSGEAGASGEDGGGAGGIPTEEEENTIPENQRTQIDDAVREIEKQNLPENVAETFTDGAYRTVVAEEDILLFRVFGGTADMGGGFFTTDEFISERDARQGSALLPEWGNTCQYQVAVLVPKGTVLNIGTTAPQTASDGKVYAGGADQILMPKNWLEEHPEWIIESIYIGEED